MGEFRMPALGADMQEGTLLEWQVQPGDVVHRGDIVAVVDTDKAAIEVECFEDGVVQELLVQPGTKVPIGTALARIDANGTPPAPNAVPAPAPMPRPVPAAVAPSEGPLVRRRRAAAKAQTKATVPAPAPAAPAQRRPRVSPFARRRAEALDVDVAAVTGTGPGGAVTAADVEQAVTAVSPVQPGVPPATPAPAPAAADRAASMRRAIGELMARSKREVPHYYLSTTIDLENAITWLRDTNASRAIGDRVVPAALMLKAAALACREVPQLNGFWQDGFVASEHVHLGVAVSMRPSGLVAPAILDADTLDLETLMHRLRDLVARARSGRLRGREMSDGTITVTSLGDNGAEAVFGVIYPPQVALVGLGRVTERPWAEHGLLGVRHCVTATLSGDHRAMDGHDGSRYLAVLDELLQSPEKL